LNKDEITICIS